MRATPFSRKLPLAGLMAAAAICAVAYHAVAGAPAECPFDPADPFSLQAKMPAGKYAGLCIDTATRRSILPLTAEQKLSYGLVEENTVAIANFYHEKKFWIIEIPRERVQGMIFQQMYLSAKLPITHGQLRFQIARTGRPMRLIEQSGQSAQGAAHAAVEYNDDVVFAEYGVRAMGHAEAFNPIHGQARDYGVAYVLESLGQATDDSRKLVIEQFRLKITADQSWDVLNAGAEIGRERKLGDVYDTLTDSCHNTAFLALRRGLHLDEHRSLLRRAEESATPLRMLRRLGLIESHSRSRIQDFWLERP